MMKNYTKKKGMIPFIKRYKTTVGYRYLVGKDGYPFGLCRTFKSALKEWFYFLGK